MRPEWQEVPVNVSTADRYVSKFERFSQHCGATRFVRMIGGRWKIQVVWTLRASPLRFAELKRRVEGIAEPMLSQQLRELEADGFVDREVFPVIPPHVEYALTANGEALLLLLGQIDEWTHEHMGGPS